MKFTVWKLGSLEQKIFPTDLAIKKLSDILKCALENNSNENDVHFVWGPDLEIMQTDEEYGKIHIIMTYDEHGVQKVIPITKEVVK